MNWRFLKEPLWRGGMASFIVPTMALEIESDFVVGARFDSATRPPRRLARLGVRGLKRDALQPLPNRPNIADSGEVQRAIREVSEIVGNGGGRLGLLIPDGAVRVAILAFETLPDDRSEAESLVLWRMAETLPFAAAEARLSYQVMRREPGGVELLAVAAKGSVLAEYEGALEPMNGGSALILPATIALLPLLPEKGQAGQLLLHVCSGWMTAVVVVGSRVRYWRNRDLGQTAADERGREVAAEAGRVLASSQDHFQVAIERVWLCARPLPNQQLRAEVARSIGQEVEFLALGENLAATLAGEERILFAQFGAPLAGLVSNSR